MALIVDAGEHIAQFCNYFEGDGFLAPYAYDSWHKLNEQMSIISERYIEVEYPSSLRAIVTQLRPDDIDAQQHIMQLTLGKVKLVKDKLEYDTLTRLDDNFKNIERLPFSELPICQRYEHRGARGGNSLCSAVTLGSAHDRRAVGGTAYVQKTSRRIHE